MSQNQKRNIRIQSKVDTKQNWETINPQLLEDEIGYEIESGKFKIGRLDQNGNEMNWNDLPYAQAGVGDTTDNNGEIFNDYENNRADIENSHVEGVNNQTFCKALVISNITDLLGDGSDIAGYMISFNDNAALSNLSAGDYINAFDADGGKYRAVIGNVSDSCIYLYLKDDGVSNIMTLLNIGAYVYPLGGRYGEIEHTPEGLVTTAHAEGKNTIALLNAHAEGISTEATGFGSHAEGNKTKARGEYAHTEGYKTLASGHTAHAEGDNTKATGFASHAEGRYNVASGDYSHAEGFAPFNAKTNTQDPNTASGLGSHAEGQGTVASGIAAHAEGSYTTASGAYTHSEGENTVASGSDSHAEGNQTEATASAAHSEGAKTHATGQQSHAEGLNTTASGYQSHAEGNNTNALGPQTHTEGLNTETLGTSTAAHAEGNGTKAYGQGSHAEGYETQALKSHSHAEGAKTIAEGDQSHAEGLETHTYGNRSHAEGWGTVANSEASHVQGKYNEIDNMNKYAHIVGNGKSDNNRSNAHTLDWEGNAWFKGLIESKGFTVLKDTSLVEINGNKINLDSLTTTGLYLCNYYTSEFEYTRIILVGNEPPNYLYQIALNLYDNITQKREYINNKWTNWKNINSPQDYNFVTLGEAFSKSNNFIKGDKITIDNINNDYWWSCGEYGDISAELFRRDNAEGNPSSNADSYTELIEYHGRFCRKIYSKQITTTEPAFLYFYIPEEIRNKVTNKITFTIAYLDEGTETIEIQYTSTDTSLAASLSTVKITKTNTRTWKTASVTVENAAFNTVNNAIQKSDFRIKSSQFSPLHISDVIVTIYPEENNEIQEAKFYINHNKTTSLLNWSTNEDSFTFYKRYTFETGFDLQNFVNKYNNLYLYSDLLSYEEYTFKFDNKKIKGYVAQPYFSFNESSIVNFLNCDIINLKLLCRDINIYNSTLSNIVFNSLEITLDYNATIFHSSNVTPTFFDIVGNNTSINDCNFMLDEMRIDCGYGGITNLSIINNILKTSTITPTINTLDGHYGFNNSQIINNTFYYPSTWDPKGIIALNMANYKYVNINKNDYIPIVEEEISE